jgi:hydroxymethylpyrimidine/phosphomethylpyrimidine kinase
VVCLTIAGSDSGGGAGIQADLKTFAALGVFGTSAVTAVTAQNTTGVRHVHVLPVESVQAQIRAVRDDFEVRSAKCGMLATAEVIAAVAAELRAQPLPALVVDPVMVAQSGARLLADDAVEILRRELLPLATVLTPNLPEATVLLGEEVGADRESRVQAARRLKQMGPGAVLLKGGHGGGDASDDLYVDGTRELDLPAPRLATTSDHGTGCTLAAALCAWLARGLDGAEASRRAKDFVTEAIRTARPLGHGHGPLHHFHEYYGGEGLP